MRFDLPFVDYVETDDPVEVATQQTPTGASWVSAPANTAVAIDGRDDRRVDVDVAVLDTGIDLDHPDLNVVGGVTCTAGVAGATCVDGGDDDQYHGTHVAGTIGAIDNDTNVVGVTPGARLWAVKVLDSAGSGTESTVVAGLDWVASQGSSTDVVNLSLTGRGFSQALYDAVQRVVAGGVAIAVAAGNEKDLAESYSPASFDNVLTVSALADFDGRPGGTGAPTCRNDQDDTLADFSNYGDAIDVAAPGVCITSTMPVGRGAYGTLSGTSMASPHVAGALALLASTNRPSSASAVADLYAEVAGAGTEDWTDDSGDGTPERLLSVAGFDAATTPGSQSARRPARLDFDGDGRSDPAVGVEGSNVWQWQIERSSDGTVGRTWVGRTGDALITGDFDGDGVTDPTAVHTLSDALQWRVVRSTDGVEQRTRYGSPGDTPVVGDFDGDGTDDLAVIVTGTNSLQWRIQQSSDGQVVQTWVGYPGNTPVVGDFDGDGVDDPAVVNPSDNVLQWRIQQSSDGQTVLQFVGFPGNTPVVGDFDGDGIDDPGAVLAGENVLQWRMLMSNTGQQLKAWLGFPDSTIIARDYDGDGIDDPGAVTPGENVYQWRTLSSATGEQTKAWLGFPDSTIIGAWG